MRHLGGLQKERPIYGRRTSYSSRRQARRKCSTASQKWQSSVAATQSMSLACHCPGRLGPGSHGLGSHGLGSQNPEGREEEDNAFPKLLPCAPLKGNPSPILSQRLYAPSQHTTIKGLTVCR